MPCTLTPSNVGELTADGERAAGRVDRPDAPEAVDVRLEVRVDGTGGGVRNRGCGAVGCRRSPRGSRSRPRRSCTRWPGCHRRLRCATTGRRCWRSTRSVRLPSPGSADRARRTRVSRRGRRRGRATGALNCWNTTAKRAPVTGSSATRYAWAAAGDVGEVAADVDAAAVRRERERAHGAVGPGLKVGVERAGVLVDHREPAARDAADRVEHTAEVQRVAADRDAVDPALRVRVERAAPRRCRGSPPRCSGAWWC